MVHSVPMARDSGDEVLETKLRLLALQVLVTERDGGRVPNMRDVSLLAAELVAEGRDTPATVEAACLTQASSFWDHQPTITTMLSEQGVLTNGNSDDAYRHVLYLFACKLLSPAVFQGWFFERLPEWTSQDVLDQELVLLFEDRDHETDPHGKTLIEEQIRSTVQSAGF